MFLIQLLLFWVLERLIYFINMNIYYVDREYQGPETENPLLINGEHKTWNVRTTTHRGDLPHLGNWDKEYKNTLQGFLKLLKIRKPYVDAIYLYDVQPRERIFCDQGCKPNEPGCRSKYVEDNFMLMITYDLEINEEKRKEYNLKRKQLELPFESDDYFSMFV
jgi:hypothetical protein